jgi:hypothetical protein
MGNVKCGEQTKSCMKNRDDGGGGGVEWTPKGGGTGHAKEPQNQGESGSDMALKIHEALV